MKIRKVQISDIPLRVRWINDSRVAESMHFSTQITERGTELWFAKIKSQKDRADLVVELGGRSIAMGGFTGIREAGHIRIGEFYVFVDPEKQGRGHGKITCYGLMVYAFEQLKLDKVVLFTNADNIRAQKVYESLGFIKEGVMRKETVNGEGVQVDRFYYGLFKNELKSYIPSY